MKKSITLLMALSLVGITGCSSGKSNLQPKGVKIQSSVFKSELLSKLDEFATKHRVVKTTDPEDLTDDAVYVIKAVSKENLTLSSPTGDTKRIRYSEVEEATVKYDADTTSFAAVTSDTEVQKEGKEKHNEKYVTDMFINEEYVFDNLAMGKETSSLAAPTLAFLSSASTFFGIFNSLHSSLTSSSLPDDLDTYKLGNVYTAYTEEDASTHLGPDIQGTIVYTTQITFTKDSISFLNVEEMKNMASRQEDTGIVAKGNMIESTYIKLSFGKNVKLKAPSADKYTDGIPM